MTLESIYQIFAQQALILVLFMLMAPWITWLICFLIPGYREEPFVLSVNLWLAMISVMFWVGYVAYATNTGGWAKVVTQANFFLLVAPIYYILTSIWVAKKRIPLEAVPAFQSLQGAAMLTVAFLMLSWFLGRIHIILFSFIPFTGILWFLAFVLGLGYIGYRQMVDKS
jgi:hypothetical protein